MLQFLIGFTVVAFVLALTCGIEWIIFHRRPNYVASFLMPPARYFSKYLWWEFAFWIVVVAVLLLSAKFVAWLSA